MPSKTARGGVARCVTGGVAYSDHALGKAFETHCDSLPGQGLSKQRAVYSEGVVTGDCAAAGGRSGCGKLTPSKYLESSESRLNRCSRLSWISDDGAVAVLGCGATIAAEPDRRSTSTTRLSRAGSRPCIQDSVSENNMSTTPKTCHQLHTIRMPRFISKLLQCCT